MVSIVIILHFKREFFSFYVFVIALGICVGSVLCLDTDLL